MPPPSGDRPLVTTPGAVALHGGVPKEEQARQLQQGADLVVATPGRLLDHLGRHRAHQAEDGLPRASLRRCTVLVYDSNPSPTPTPNPTPDS